MDSLPDTLGDVDFSWWIALTFGQQVSVIGLVLAVPAALAATLGILKLARGHRRPLLVVESNALYPNDVMNTPVWQVEIFNRSTVEAHDVRFKLEGEERSHGLDNEWSAESILLPGKSVKLDQNMTGLVAMWPDGKREYELGPVNAEQILLVVTWREPPSMRRRKMTVVPVDASGQCW